MQRVIVFYSGRVQGVGFRVTARRLACGYNVVGAVRNVSDGRVELIAEGTRSELEAFLTGIVESELSGFIAKKSETWQEAQGDLRGFVIVP
ncbi:MAG: acylphosphatase [Methylacidiphilales bacterium]|nr:acylphosphatase [Candidatus Methylacidiphilales bacterium]